MIMLVLVNHVHFLAPPKNKLNNSLIQKSDDSYSRNYSRVNRYNIVFERK